MFDDKVKEELVVEHSSVKFKRLSSAQSISNAATKSPLQDIFFSLGASFFLSRFPTMTGSTVRCLEFFSGIGGLVIANAGSNVYVINNLFSVLLAPWCQHCWHRR